MACTVPRLALLRIDDQALRHRAAWDKGGAAGHPLHDEFPLGGGAVAVITAVALELPAARPQR